MNQFLYFVGAITFFCMSAKNSVVSRFRSHHYILIQVSIDHFIDCTVCLLGPYAYIDV